MTLKSLITTTSIAVCSLMGLHSIAFADSHGGANHMGRTIGVSCAGCHGTDGVSHSPHLRSISELSEEKIVTALKKFKSGERKGSIMNRIAKGYTDEQITAVAHYFATVNK